MKRPPSQLLAATFQHLTIEYVVIPALVPLFSAGVIAVFCTVSIAEKESVYPASPPLGLHEPFATAALGLLSLIVAVPYFLWSFRMNIDSTFFGYSRRFWRILIASTFVTAVVLATLFAVLIFNFFSML